MLVPRGSGNKTSSGILDHLQSVQQLTSDTDQQTVAVVQSAADESVHKFLLPSRTAITYASCDAGQHQTIQHNRLYYTDSMSLPSVQSVMDLGVHVDSTLRFSSHYDDIVIKAHQRAALILRCFECRDPLVLFRAFTVYVRPILEYCSPV